MAGRGNSLPTVTAKPRPMPKPRHLEKASTLSHEINQDDSLSSSPPRLLPRPKPRMQNKRNCQTLGAVSEGKTKLFDDQSLNSDVTLDENVELVDSVKPPLKQKPTGISESPISSPRLAKKPPPPKKPLPDLPAVEKTDKVTKSHTLGVVSHPDGLKPKPIRPPKPDIKHSQLKFGVNTSQDKMDDKSSLPKTDAKSSLPKTDVKSLQPKTNISACLPKADIGSSQLKTDDAKSSLPETDVKPSQPEADAKSSQPKIDVCTSLPKTDVKSSQPKTDTISLQPKTEPISPLHNIDTKSPLPKQETCSKIAAKLLADGKALSPQILRKSPSRHSGKETGKVIEELSGDGENKVDSTQRPALPHKPHPPRPPPPHGKISPSLQTRTREAVGSKGSPPLKPRRKTHDSLAATSSASSTVDEVFQTSEGTVKDQQTDSAVSPLCSRKIASSKKEEFVQSEEKQERKNSIKEIISSAFKRRSSSESRPPPPQKPPPQLPLSRDESPHSSPQENMWDHEDKITTKSLLDEVRTRINSTGKTMQMYDQKPTWFAEKGEKHRPEPYEIVEIESNEFGQVVTFPGGSVLDHHHDEAAPIPVQKMNRRMAKSQKQFTQEKLEKNNNQKYLTCHSTSMRPSDMSKRRPAPLPPEENAPGKKVSSHKPPPLPTTPRPSTMLISQLIQDSNDISKARSMECLAHSLEDDDYAYAYNNHGGSLPLLPTTGPELKHISGTFKPKEVSHQQVDEYEIPGQSVVTDFVQHLQKKDQQSEEENFSGYEDIDQSVIDGFLEVLNTNTAQNDVVEVEDDYVTPDESVVNQFQWSLQHNNNEQHEGTDTNPIDGGYIEPLSPPSSPPPERPPKNPVTDRPLPMLPKQPAPNNTSAQDHQDTPVFTPAGDDDKEEDPYVEAYQEINEPSDSDSDHEYEEYGEEPLYQVYTASVIQRQKTASLGRKKKTEKYMDVLTLGSNKSMRMLWSQLPEVRESGILDTMKTEERKRQEATFEVITSEASYLKSLNFLFNHFMSAECFNPDSPAAVVDREQHHVLFSNIEAIREVSQRFLDDLRERQKEAVVISTISDIILEHASKYFDVYIKYCSNQIFQDRLHTCLVKENAKFMDAVINLESTPSCQGLTLQSFLVLPMQRITRMPLLVDAICHRYDFNTKDFEETDAALRAVNKVVRDCNEGARQIEQIEEINNLQKEIVFKCKSIAIVSGSRFLLRRGDLTMLSGHDSKSLIKSPLKIIKGKDKQEQIYIFLFNDLLLIAKKKSDSLYKVFDHANRTMAQVESLQDNAVPGGKNLLSLILLENSESKTRDMVISAPSQTDKMRWLSAFSPPKAEIEGETIYGSWDCPQVQAIHYYQGQQPDELTLQEGDVMNVLRKMQDGWYEGERLRDGCKGWFPANHTEEVVNEHVRKRNLMQRYRLLVASKNLVRTLMR